MANQRQSPPVRKAPQRPAQTTNTTSVTYIIIVSVVVFSMLIAGLAAIDWGSIFASDPDPTPDVNTNQLAVQQTVVAQNPDNVQEQILLASMLSNSGRVQEAIPVYEKAIALDPENGDTRRQFAMSLQANGLNQDAEAQFLKALELNPNDHTAHYYLARLYQDWQPTRQAEAEEHFRRVIEIAPNSFLAEQSQNVLDTSGLATPVSDIATPMASPTPTQ